MSSISVAGDVSGAISIAAPSAAGSGVLTLPTGTDTLVGKATTDTLTNKSIAATQLTGTIAAAALPAGSVLQVVSATRTATTSTTSTSFVTSNLTASITPRSTSSKILALVSSTVATANNVTGISATIYRDATNLGAGNPITGLVTGGNNYVMTFAYLDSPSTTSATTYTFYFKSDNASTVYANLTGYTSSLVLMEIQG